MTIFRKLLEFSVVSMLASWLVATLGCQVSTQLHQRISALDPFSSGIPNWRFFAPNPARHDFRVVYRCLYVDETQSEWIDAGGWWSRKVAHSFWFPDRRAGKSINDACSGMQRAGTTANRPAMEALMEYKLLRGWIADKARKETKQDVEGFQFMILQDSGHDESQLPVRIFVSKFERLGLA